MSRRQRRGARSTQAALPSADQAAEICRLQQEIDRLRMERDILKKASRSSWRRSKEMIFQLIDETRPDFPVENVVRRSWCFKKRLLRVEIAPALCARAVEDGELLGRDAAKSTERATRTYGSTRASTPSCVATADASENRRIERLMRRAGIRGGRRCHRQARTTDSNHGLPIAPNWRDRDLGRGAQPGSGSPISPTSPPSGLALPRRNHGSRHPQDRRLGDAEEHSTPRSRSPPGTWPSKRQRPAPG